MLDLTLLSGHGDTIRLKDEVAVFQNFPKRKLWEMRGLVMRIQKEEKGCLGCRIFIKLIVIEAQRSLQSREDVGKSVYVEVNPSKEMFCRVFKKFPGKKERDEVERAARYGG